MEVPDVAPAIAVLAVISNSLSLPTALRIISASSVLLLSEYRIGVYHTSPSSPNAARPGHRLEIPIPEICDKSSPLPSDTSSKHFRNALHISSVSICW